MSLKVIREFTYLEVTEAYAIVAVQYSFDFTMWNG